MSNPAGKPKPFSVRFSEAEKAVLRARAGGVPLGEYIRSTVLGDATESQSHRRHRAPVKDADALGQVLGLLGQSRLANNLNQLAKAANQGSLPVTDDLEADLKRACTDILIMRQWLMRALGKRPVESQPSASGEFDTAARRSAK